MVPVASHLINLASVDGEKNVYLIMNNTHHKIVGETAVRWDRTLRCSSRAIHGWSSSLIDAMPMKACRLITQVIGDGHDQPVSFVDIDLRTWPLAVDANDWPREAIRTRSDPIDTPVIFHCSRRSTQAIAKGQNQQREHIYRGERRFAERTRKTFSRGRTRAYVAVRSRVTAAQRVIENTWSGMKSDIALFDLTFGGRQGTLLRMKGVSVVEKDA